MISHKNVVLIICLIPCISYIVLMGQEARVFDVEVLIAMQGHKVGNFMVKDDILGLDLGYGQKSLRIKLLIRRNKT